MKMSHYGFSLKLPLRIFKNTIDRHKQQHQQHHHQGQQHLRLLLPPLPRRPEVFRLSLWRPSSNVNENFSGGFDGSFPVSL